MTLVVEDGTGLADAESYVSVEEYLDYMSRTVDKDIADSDTLLEATLRRATRYIDGRYASRWPGYKLNGREQALAWPRRLVVDSHGDIVPSDAVPREIKDATIEAAERERVSPGSLSPDYDPTQRVISETVGPISTTYADVQGTTPRPSITVIDEILWPLLLSTGGAVLAIRRA